MALRFLASIFCCSLLTSVAVSHDDRAEASVILQSFLNDLECPGALVGVFPDEGDWWTTAIGVADVESQLPMNVGMRMRIGSVSKVFVGATVLCLVDQGKLSLDDPVSKYVAGVPHGDRITLRMLGNQTSGLFDSIGSSAFQAAILKEPRRLWKPAEIFVCSFREPPYFEPGERFRYCNVGTVLLGEVIEAVTGKPLPEVVQETVCEPLGLESTGFCMAAGPPAPTPSAYRFAAPGRWLGYGEEFTDVTGYSASWSSWAGDMYSTLDDLGKAIKPLATGSLLTKATRQELYEWSSPKSEPSRYGFLIRKDELGIGHDGDVPGFNASVRYSAELKTGFVALTNLSNCSDGRMPAEELTTELVSLDSKPGDERAPATR